MCGEGFPHPLHRRKNFQNLLKNRAILDYFLSLSQVIKYFCMEVYIDRGNKGKK